MLCRHPVPVPTKILLCKCFDLLSYLGTVLSFNQSCVYLYGMWYDEGGNLQGKYWITVKLSCNILLGYINCGRIMFFFFFFGQFLSLLDSNAAFNYEVIRDCYEAFALYCFERYLIACLGMMGVPNVALLNLYNLSKLEFVM